MKDFVGRVGGFVDEVGSPIGMGFLGYCAAGISMGALRRLAPESFLAARLNSSTALPETLAQMAAVAAAFATYNGNKNAQEARLPPPPPPLNLVPPAWFKAADAQHDGMLAEASKRQRE